MARHMTLATAAVLLLTYAASAGEQPQPSVNYAKSWETAVEEAKTLNLPIVVHSHGFY